MVFPVLHGPFGEDGTIQGLLETLGLPYVGAGVLGSAASMDKAFCKAVLRDAGIAVARSLVLRHGVDDPLDPAVVTRVGETLGWPVFVKPANLGSSVGISKVHGPEELPDALELSFRHDEKALVEEFVAGREIECGVLGNERPVASAVGEILPHAEWYDYAAKYDEGGSDIVVPADLPVPVAERVREHRPRRVPGARAERHGARRLLPRRPAARCSSTRSTRSRASRPPRSTRASSRPPAWAIPRCSTGSCSARSTATRGARATATETRYGREAVCSFASAMLAAKPVSVGASFVIQIR